MKGNERAREGWAGLYCEDGSSSEMRRGIERGMEEMREDGGKHEEDGKHDEKRLMGTFDGRNQMEEMRAR